MTPYLTAQAAATRLGKSEKTIRRWIAEGRLLAHHPNGRKNMLAIAESDIERLAQEEAQYKQPAEDQDTGALAARIAQLEQRVSELEQRASVGTPAQPAAAEHTTRTRTPHTNATYEIPERLPQGSMPYHRFAELHGVPARTFLDHIDKGHVPAIVRQRPNRKEKARWLSPEHQRQAINYWQANGTSYHDCDLCPHDDSVYQRAGQDQEETA